MIRVAFQGLPGAFSHEACAASLPDAQPEPFRTFEETFAAVQAGACALGFVPVENSTAGPVPGVARLLPGCGLDILREVRWPVRLQLMAVPGVSLGDIRVAASHPMALAQCRIELSALGIEAEEAYDTAGAAADLAASKDPTRAAIAGAGAARLYGLSILKADIEDRGDNVTRFLVLQRPGG